MKLIQPHLEMIIRNQADKKYPHRLTLRLASALRKLKVSATLSWRN